MHVVEAGFEMCIVHATAVRWYMIAFNSNLQQRK